MGQPTTPTEPASRYPLTFRQKDPTGAARAPDDVIALTLRIKGTLRIDCLQQALDDVVERHEALRTRIHYDQTDGNQGFQEVLPALPVPLTVHSAPTSPGRTRDDVAADLLKTVGAEKMSFTDTPSLRATLYQFDNDDAVLTLLTHHLYSDGWSADIIRREIAACYRARATGAPHTLPTPTPYRQFAAWEQEFLHSAKAAAARQFWKNKLAGAQLCTMPADRLHGPDTRAPQPAVGNFSIDPDNFARVATSAAQHRCSVWHVFLAALMTLTERASHRTDITMLTVSSGRPARTFYDTVGVFADLLPVRLEFGACTTFQDLMLLARKASADAIQNQIPFGVILEMFPELLVVEDPRVLVPGFNYIGAPAAPDDTRFTITIEQVLPSEEVPGEFLRGAFKWNLRVAPPGEFRCAVEYEPDAVDASTIERWGSDFVNLILTIADRPDQPWKTV
jgi:condensation enzyme